jgi:RNA polymerase sigma-70 factor (ECF subfamily)
MRIQETGTDFERRFGPFRSRVTSYLSRLTGSRADAEDLTQETLLSAFQQQEGFRMGAAPLPYLLGIARRRWRDRRRSQHENIVLEDNTIPHADATPQLIEALTLRAALARLSEAERRVLELTAVQGRTYKEAAAILGEPAGTLKWRVHVAFRKLRILLSDEEVSS